MDTSCTSDKDVAQALRQYKILSEKPENHFHLLKEKTIILFAASLLDSSDRSTVSLCLDIIDNLIYNSTTHSTLITTFGIFEALESTSIRLRGIDSKLSNRAADMTDILRKGAPPAYSTRLRTKGRQQRMKSTMYQLYIPPLIAENRLELEESLLKIKGVISFVIDIEQQKCTIRISPKVTIAGVIGFVHDNAGMKAMLVSKKPGDLCEVYIDVFNKSNRSKGYPEYLPEDESPPRGKSITNMKNLSASAGDWIKSAGDFLSNSFYW